MCGYELFKEILKETDTPKDRKSCPECENIREEIRSKNIGVFLHTHIDNVHVADTLFDVITTLRRRLQDYHVQLATMVIDEICENCNNWEEKTKIIGKCKLPDFNETHFYFHCVLFSPKDK